MSLFESDSASAYKHILFDYSMVISRGGGGGRGSGPPGKSQVIWMSIGMSNCAPPLEKVGPSLENVGPPLEPRTMIVFFESNHWTYS